jgi:Flp pilus assembly protein TadG
VDAVSTAVRDRGAADALGLVLIAPAIIGLALLVIHLGRHVDANAQVRTAAESAAQAAALQRSPGQAVAAATSTATAMLTDPDTCATPAVSTDVSRFVPGGSVTVTVACGVSRRGVEPVVRSSSRRAATAVATVDPYRAVLP